jgi:hypothetical protein
MSDLDRWAREHRHRIKREQIAAIRASRQNHFWPGSFASGQIGSGAVSSPMLVSGCVSRGMLAPTPFDWSKVYGAVRS